MCIVFTNDRYCLSDGLPQNYAQCMIIYSDNPYIPVHIKFRGRHGEESECLNPNEPQSTCQRIYRMTYPRGIKARYLQTRCRGGKPILEKHTADGSSSFSCRTQVEVKFGVGLKIPEWSDRCVLIIIWSFPLDIIITINEAGYKIFSGVYKLLSGIFVVDVFAAFTLI